MSALGTLRRAENWAVGRVRAGRPPDLEHCVSWSIQRLEGFDYCLLTTLRRDGTPVSVPMWFAPDPATGEIVVRSGAGDGKVRRIHRDATAYLTASSVRGEPLGPSMQGRARLLAASETAGAESLLRRRYGRRRVVYNVVRAPLLDMAYIAIGAGDP